MNKAQLIEAIQKPETNDPATEATTEKPVAKSHMYVGSYVAEPAKEDAGVEKPEDEESAKLRNRAGKALSDKL